MLVSSIIIVIYLEFITFLTVDSQQHNNDVKLVIPRSFVNYGWQYWAERLHLLSSDAQRRCINFYLNRRV